MKINKELLLHVAKTARLKLSEEEIKEFLPQLEEVLKSFSEISEVNTDNILPSFQPIQIKNVFREDAIKNCLSQKEALKNTIHKKNGYFKGPKVV